jgi:formamidopyrimidine-DNA glycosylase
MPELAEVAFFAKQWTPGIGEPVIRVAANATARVFKETAAAAYPPGLNGLRLLGIETHGKQMLFRFGPKTTTSAWLGGHLGMTGEIRLEATDFTPTKHDHLVLFQKRRALVFRDPRKFGALRLDVGPQAPAWWAELPTSIFSPHYTLAHITAFLTRHGKSLIKPLLLDQSAFPGIGNWMADEILWRTRIHPTALAASLSKPQLKKLHTAVIDIGRYAMDTIGQTYADPPPNWLFTHRWKPGGHCPKCNQELLRESLRGRTACWCGKCQVARA